MDRALILYSELAELGYDVAQSNMGHILDQGKSSLGSGGHEKALRAFEMSVRYRPCLALGHYYCAADTIGILPMLTSLAQNDFA
jgi:hypothetical protein